MQKAWLAFSMSILRKRQLACIFCTLFILSLCFFSLNLDKLSSEIDCSDGSSLLFIEEVCHNYSLNKIAGSVCDSLCRQNDIVFEKCLGHDTFSRVMKAKWNQHYVILKSKMSIEATSRFHFRSKREKSINYPCKQFAELLQSSTTMNYFGGKVKISPNLKIFEEIAQSCDVDKNGIVVYHEALYCWYLVDNHDYLMSLLLKDNLAIPNLLGFCGPLFVQEYVPSELLHNPGLKKETRSWQVRAKLAIAFIEMTELLEHTKYGRLYLCDVKEENFGVFETVADGTLHIKPIDLDITWFEPSLRAELVHQMPTPCNNDNDCSIVHCLTECDRKSLLCSNKVIYSNNLQIICQRLFLSRYFLFHTGLLESPPLSHKKEINRLVRHCAFPGHPTPNVSLELAQQLKNLLEASLL